MTRFENKTALVTGAGKGIGKAIAKQLANQGANVIIIGRTENTLKESAAQDSKITYMVADLESTNDMVQVLASISKLDILVNNAGMAPVTPFEEMEMNEYDKVFNVNVRGLVNLTKQTLPFLKSSKGNIINISTSIVGKPMANMSVYAASKTAVNTFTRVWPKEFANYGIRVNSVGVGSIETPIYEKTALSKKETQKHINGVKQIVPLGRFGTANEVASIVSFLASDEASFITGSDYAVDGGFGA